jgi:hypothetical protein
MWEVLSIVGLGKPSVVQPPSRITGVRRFATTFGEPRFAVCAGLLGCKREAAGCA